MRFLTAKEKISELARMLGGVEITKKTLEHAREMVEKV
jgi:DNA repair ATPase RecN